MTSINKVMHLDREMGYTLLKSLSTSSLSMEITLGFKKKNYRQPLKNNGWRADPSSEQTKEQDRQGSGPQRSLSSSFDSEA